MTALVPLLALLAMPAARVDGQVILLSDVDAATNGRAEALRSRLVEVVEAAAWRAVDDHLAIPDPDVRPATDAELAERRDQVPTDLGPALREQALRWQIEREHRDADRAAVRKAAYARFAARVEVPAAERLDAALPAEEAIAWVGGESVAAAEIERAAAVALYRLRGELFRERTRRLEETIAARLLGAEAERRDVPVERLVIRNVVTAEDVAAYVEASRKDGQPPPDPARVTPLLEARARHEARRRLVARLRNEADVEILLEPPPVPKLDATDPTAPALGPAAPPDRTIVFFANYRARAARRVHLELDTLRAADPSLRIEFRAFAPAFDPVASEAALLERCVERFGGLEVWRQVVLAREPPPLGTGWFDDSGLEALAARMGTDAGSLRTCMRDPVVTQAIERDGAAAEWLGFTDVPALVVAGQPLTGLQSAATMGAILDRRRGPIR